MRLGEEGEGGEGGGVGSGGAGISTLEGLLQSVRRFHAMEVERGRKARVMTVEELTELSQEDLLKMQENLAAALNKKYELDRFCSICLERQKDFVCVPCGHRYCSICVAEIDRCAECREKIQQKLKCF